MIKLDFQKNKPYLTLQLWAIDDESPEKVTAAVMISDKKKQQLKFIPSALILLW